MDTRLTLIGFSLLGAVYILLSIVVLSLLSRLERLEKDMLERASSSDDTEVWETAPSLLLPKSQMSTMIIGVPPKLKIGSRGMNQTDQKREGLAHDPSLHGRDSFSPS